MVVGFVEICINDIKLLQAVANCIQLNVSKSNTANNGNSAGVLNSNHDYNR